MYNKLALIGHTIWRHAENGLFNLLIKYIKFIEIIEIYQNKTFTIIEAISETALGNILRTL